MFDNVFSGCCLYTSDIINSTICFCMCCIVYVCETVWCAWDSEKILTSDLSGSPVSSFIHVHVTSYCMSLCGMVTVHSLPILPPHYTVW